MGPFSVKISGATRSVLNENQQSEYHKEPHLLVRDMTAWHERSPHVENHHIAEPVTTGVMPESW
jgi:hypothetical protein